MTVRGDARLAPPTTRRVGHLLVDVALLGLAAALIALVLAVAPGPEVCPLPFPSPSPCFQVDRDQIALMTVISVGVLAVGGWIVNHLLRGRTRAIVLVVLVIAALVAGLLGAASLHFQFWIVPPSLIL